MAASTDLLPEQHNRGPEVQDMCNAAGESSSRTWGTWEELILVSAVKKHGVDNWELVSKELQTRARASGFSFTAEECRAAYQEIKRRFGSDEGRKGNAVLLFEELRRLRVAQLRLELDQIDNSIGSLENKIKHLQLEREKGGNDTTGDTIDQSVLSGARRTCSSTALASGSKDETSIRSLATVISGPVKSSALPAHGDKDVDVPSPLSTVQQDDAMIKPELKNTNRFLSDSEATCVVTSSDVGEAPRLSKEGGDLLLPFNSKSDARSLSSMKDGKEVDMYSDQSERNQCPCAANNQSSGTDQPVSMDWKSLSTNRDLDDRNLKSSAVCKGETRKLKDGEVEGSKSETSKSLCSPRIKSSPSNHRQNMNGLDEACLQHNDKPLVYRLATKENTESPLVESADSTEGKRQETLVALKDNSPVNKLKAEESTVEEDMPDRSGRDGFLAPVEPSAAPAGCLKVETKDFSTSSSENSHLHEVWGESMEVVDKPLTFSSTKGRLYGRKRKFSGTVPQNIKEDSNGTDPSGHPDSSLRTESLTSSHDGSESLHSPGLENDGERFSGDSRVEKSEVGSYVDGNEDVSPMSGRNRKEPKVPGKLIPLLACLRNLSAHKCAPMFKHNTDSQDNARYNLVIRLPIDLAVVRARLEDGQYSGSLPFFRDLLLMVNNALVYHPKESAEMTAAFGLRECIMNEMKTVFETEALVKQEGPSFRKRDTGKLGRASSASNQGRKRIRKSSSRLNRSRDHVIKQSVDSTLDGVAQNLTTCNDEAVKTEKHIAENVSVSDLDSRVPGDKMPLAGSEKCSLEEPASPHKGKTDSIVKDAKDKEKLGESSASRQDEVKTGNHKTLKKGVKDGQKTKDLQVTQGPIKRVGRPPGRPPKHSRTQRAQKEVLNASRKIVKRR